ncbi:unnamed protein product, partial [Didymodactylos carnosus]
REPYYYAKEKYGSVDIEKNIDGQLEWEYQEALRLLTVKFSPNILQLHSRSKQFSHTSTMNGDDIVRNLTQSLQMTQFSAAFISTVKKQLSEITETHFKLHAVSMWLRDMKFNEIDWRNEDRWLPEKFQANDDLHNEEELDKIDIARPHLFKVERETMSDINLKREKPGWYIRRYEPDTWFNLLQQAYYDHNEGWLIERLLHPFRTHVEQLRFRLTAAYYFCYYTFRQHPLLKQLDKQCALLIGSSSFELEQQRWSFNGDFSENGSFACAYLSFCPDPCCGLITQRRIRLAHTKLVELEKAEMNRLEKKRKSLFG